MNLEPEAQILADIKEAHGWATRAFDDAKKGSNPSQQFALKAERERLAHRFAAVKRGAHPDGTWPTWKYPGR
jgi:hypothetical protein